MFLTLTIRRMISQSHPCCTGLGGEAGAGMSCRVGRTHGSGDDTHESRRWSKKKSMVINHSRAFKVEKKNFGHF